MRVQSLGQEDPLEESMAAHSSVLAWRILWAEEPGRWQSTGSQRVRPDWSNLAGTHATYIYHISHLNMHSSVALSSSTMLLNHHHHPSPDLLSSCKTETWFPPDPSSPLPSLHLLTTPLSLSFSTNLTAKYIVWLDNYRSHPVRTDLLIPLSVTSSGFIYVVCSMSEFTSSLRLNGTPLYA